MYELSVMLKPTATNIYAVYGKELSPMIIPPAYQIQENIGVNVGGINPVILNYVHDSILDSWFTISIIDGDNMNYVNSIGIPWNDWSQDLGLTVMNGAIFLNDPLMTLSDTNEYIISHLTLDDSESHTLSVNLDGRIYSAPATTKFTESDVTFVIPKKTDMQIIS